VSFSELIFLNFSDPGLKRRFISFLSDLPFPDTSPSLFKDVPTICSPSSFNFVPPQSASFYPPIDCLSELSFHGPRNKIRKQSAASLRTSKYVRRVVLFPFLPDEAQCSCSPQKPFVFHEEVPELCPTSLPLRT